MILFKCMITESIFAASISAEEQTVSEQDHVPEYSRGEEVFRKGGIKHQPTPRLPSYAEATAGQAGGGTREHRVHRDSGRAECREVRMMLLLLRLEAG